MFPLGLLSQAYFMCALVGGGFLVFNFVMGHIDEGDGCDVGHGGGHHDVGHDGGGHHDVGHSGGHDSGHHDGSHDGGHSAESQTTSRYGLVGVDTRLSSKIGKILLGILSPMTIAIFLAFFGLTGYMTGYLMPWLNYLTLIPAALAGMAMINIFKAGIKAMMRYGTSSSHMKTDEIIGHVAEVLVPIAENRPGEVTYVIQSKIYSSAARSKGIAINKGTKVMIVETDGPTLFVEPYKETLYLD
jgi:membrane protein implicated in regulation of membrane protease activity